MTETIIGLIPAIVYVLLMAVIGWVAYKLTNWMMNFDIRFDDEFIDEEDII